MKIITQYQCEICGKPHETEDAARECESKGTFDVTPFKIGILWPHNHHGFVGIFSFGDPRKYAGDPHIGETSYLAFRTPKFAGGMDSTFENGLCGGDFLSSYNGNTPFRHFFGIGEPHWDGRWMRPEYLKTPEFIRACRYMVEHGIQPRYVTESGETVDVVLTAEMIPESMVVVNIPAGKYTINISCPGCGNDIRPTMFAGSTFRGSHRINCDQWACGCGHVHKYEHVVEKGFRVAEFVKTYLEQQTIARIDADESTHGNRKWE